VDWKLTLSTAEEGEGMTTHLEYTRGRCRTGDPPGVLQRRCWTGSPPIISQSKMQGWKPTTAEEGEGIATQLEYSIGRCTAGYSPGTSQRKALDW
jgi:hypothetical protein